MRRLSLSSKGSNNNPLNHIDNTLTHKANPLLLREFPRFCDGCLHLSHQGGHHRRIGGAHPNGCLER